MPNNRIPVIQRVAYGMRHGTAIDVYALAETLKSEFPLVAETELVRIVNEEVVAAGACAVWEKRDH